MFPSRSTNIASDLPLWAVQFDRTPGVSTVTTFMGGWTKAYAKQYTLGKWTPRAGDVCSLQAYANLVYL